MTEEDQDHVSPVAYPLLRDILEAERQAVGVSIEELINLAGDLLDNDLELVAAYRRFVEGDRLALSWPDAFLVALALNIGPRDLLLSFPSAFDMGGKPYIIIYQLDPTRSKLEIWQQFLQLWRES
jgi:hypothetical protein